MFKELALAAVGTSNISDNKHYMSIVSNITIPVKVGFKERSNIYF